MFRSPLVLILLGIALGMFVIPRVKSALGR